jgi:serine/threonine protein phosphatase PrpC
LTRTGESQMDQHLTRSMGAPADDILVSVSARTDVGRQRRGNEDAFLIADLTSGKVGLSPEVITHSIGERGSLLIVSDGMGGAAAGEIASEIAVKTIRESLLEIPQHLETAQRIRIATEVANERIWNEAQHKPELAGMGATVTAALVQGATTYIAQVGDSRAYIIRGEQIKQITKDQSYAQALRDSGIFSAEQIAKAPKNVILQALGTQPAVEVGLTAVELLRNDYLIVCSDGLSGKIKPNEMCDVVRQSPNLTSACRRLVDIANERGGEDNITVIVALFDGVGLDAANESTSITGSFKSLSKDYRSAQTLPETLPLTSVPAADENLRTVMMPALGSVKRTPAEPNTKQSAADISPNQVQGTAASVPKQKYVTIVLKPTASKKKGVRLSWLVFFVFVLLLLSAAGYLLYISSK